MKQFLLLFLLAFPTLAQAGEFDFHVEDFGTETAESRPVQDTYRSWDFGSIWIHTSRSVRYTITAGSTDAPIREILYYGGAYYVSTNCPIVLPAKQMCDVRITFTPFFEGLATGRVIVDLYTQRFIVDL